MLVEWKGRAHKEAQRAHSMAAADKNDVPNDCRHGKELYGRTARGCAFKSSQFLTDRAQSYLSRRLSMGDTGRVFWREVEGETMCGMGMERERVCLFVGWLLNVPATS